MSQKVVTIIVDNEDVSGLNSNHTWATINFDDYNSKLVIDWAIINRLLVIREHEEKKYSELQSK